VLNVVSPGVVIDPATILKEIDGLLARGIQVGDNLMLSDRAHIVCPWHIVEDRLLNGVPVGGEAIGTTLRGIGPCYRDKVGRTNALRLGDLYRPDFGERIGRIIEIKRKSLAGWDGQVRDELDAGRIHSEYAAYASRLQRYVTDTTRFLLDAVDSGRRILFEGAQGALLDVDHGTFPFVTSSNSSGVGVAAGAGVPPRFIEHVIGVAKCYTTRVGGGPFPTEQNNETGQRIRELGKEYGTTTGRPRRCGWFDAVAVRYTARLSGVDMLAIMMLDVLSHLPEIQICVAYELDGERITHFPSHVDDLRRVKPVYEHFPGWQVDVSRLRSRRDLPAGALRFLDRVAELVGRPIRVISVGPDRDQTIDSP
jgi:adenylosuccinate synthase